MIKILDARWFNTVGIVQVEDQYDGIKYYIGIGDGHSEEVDTKFIADWGSYFPKDAGDALFGVKW